MTFTEIQTAITDRMELTSPEAITRVQSAINRKYREITASLGIKHVSRRATVSSVMGIGASTLTFAGEKVVNIFNRNLTPYKQLDEVTIDELEAQMPFNASDTPSRYAIKTMGANTVTVLLDCTSQTAFALYADVYSAAVTLTGTDTPIFSESYHDILVSAVLIDEYMKKEKPALSKVESDRVDIRMGQLRLWVAVSTTKKGFQGKTKEQNMTFGPGGSGGSGGSNGALSYTQSGLITFDRSTTGAGLPPFAVAAASSAKVTNLDADKLDGSDWNTVGVLPDAGLGLTDVVTNNVTSAKHGLAPKSPADATLFLNGAATPAYAAVKGSDLVLADVATNNVTSAAHGFVPKSPADATKFLNGAATPVFAQVKDADLIFTDVATNNSSAANHGFLKKLSTVATEYMNGAGNWVTIPAPTVIYPPTLTSIINTAALTTFLSWSVPANAMLDGDTIEVIFAVLLKNNKGTAGTMEISLDWGGTAITVTDGAGGFAWSNNAAERKWMFRITMQRVVNDLWVYGPQSTAAIPMDQPNGTNPTVTPGGAVSMTPTFSSLATVALKGTLSAADATFYWKPQTAKVRRTT